VRDAIFIPASLPELQSASVCHLQQISLIYVTDQSQLQGGSCTIPGVTVQWGCKIQVGLIGGQLTLDSFPADRFKYISVSAIFGSSRGFQYERGEKEFLVCSLSGRNDKEGCGEETPRMVYD
jgi:hypothetical protein